MPAAFEAVYRANARAIAAYFARRGYTAVLAATQTAAGRVELTEGAVPSPAPSCFSTEVPTRIPVKGPTPPAIKAQIRKIQREMAAKRAAEARRAAAKH